MALGDTDSIIGRSLRKKSCKGETLGIDSSIETEIVIYQKMTKHPLSNELPTFSDKTFAAMWEMFVHIGKFWQNMEEPTPYKSLLYNFMLNRINLRPIYRDYYIIAERTMKNLIDKNGGDKDQAYKYLFTDQDAAQMPPRTSIALTRQVVANEFMALQLSLGGFKEFGAKNYCGYIGGAYIQNQPAPYRV